METTSSLLQKAINLTLDDSTQSFTGVSDTATFLKQELNNTLRDVFRLIKKYSLQPPPITDTTVAGQTYYVNPPELSKIETVTCTAGNMVIPLKRIESQFEWDRLHQVPLQSGFPIAYFPRRDDYGIFPTPQANSATITLTGNYTPTNLTVADYTTGTVSVTNGSAILTGAGVTWLSSMVGYWFALTDSSGVPYGNWYKIGTFTSSSSLSITTAYQGSTASSQTYLIAQTPNCPEELQEFLPYRAASAYYQFRRNDPVKAQQLLNFYYTGDYANTNRSGNIRGGILGILQELQNNGRGNDQLTEMGPSPTYPLQFGGVWTTVIGQIS